MKVAVCLFVRNEVSDIACWLAWYHVLGFDACIVFDDYSTDGTWELLTAASRVQDIRLSRSLGKQDGSHQPRQSGCYLRAIETFRNEFDWVGFFDSDEYLRLMDGSSIKEFLARFSEGGAVSVNWCCYGSNGHVLKPDLLPVEAYTWHSKAEASINRHVKTVLHLGSWQGQYINQHYFDVPATKAVNPSGVPMQWSQTLGISATLPDWHVAKVMHFQCRSMEHFVERLKRIPTLPRTTRLWTDTDTNDVEDRGPISLLSTLKEQIARYNLPHNLNLSKTIEASPSKYQMQTPDNGLIIDVGVSEGNDSAFYLAKGFCVIAVEADPRACEALQVRFYKEVTEGRLEILNFAVGAELGRRAKIFVHNEHQGISGVSKRPDVTDDYVIFDVPTIDWRTLYARRGSPRYLKIDVEGSEAPFMRSMLSSKDLPEFISAECYSFAPIELLAQMGYTRFKLIDQNPEGGFRLPGRQFEGNQITWDNFSHSSGPFGLDVFQDGIWLNFPEIKTAWEKARLIMARTWFDCHAWKLN